MEVGGTAAAHPGRRGALGVGVIFMRHGLAMFSIEYRLGREGGFPENIRDCRNAIRFIRKNAARFHIDPDRIAVMGGSAGGHLSFFPWAQMVPRTFLDDWRTGRQFGRDQRAGVGFVQFHSTDGFCPILESRAQRRNHQSGWRNLLPRTG